MTGGLSFQSNRRVDSSGQLNAKQRELLELQAYAQRRLKGLRANVSEGLKAAKETKRDLEWTQKRVR
jgi:biogenesis of lysosome-related organelles complex 1 subunit KXD1